MREVREREGGKGKAGRQKRGGEGGKGRGRVAERLLREEQKGG